MIPVLNFEAEELKSLLKRFLISLPFFAVSIILFTKGSFISVLAVFPLIPPAFLLAEPLAGLLAHPAGSVFNPNYRNKEINLMFSVPEARIMEGRYEEALELFRKMIPRDTQRLEIYMRIMNLAVNDMKQLEIAKETFHTGIKNMKNLRNRRILAYEYKRLMALFRDTCDDWKDD